MLKRTPQQERSRALVGCVLEAATRILSTRPLREATTNHIAEVAGIGIGSLYQYFDNKEAIAQRLLKQHRDDSITLANDALRGARGNLADRYRAMMRELLALHQRNRMLHLNLMRVEEHTAFCADVEVRRHLDLLEQLLLNDCPNLDAVALHAQVMMRSVHTLVHGAIELPDPRRERIALEHYDAFMPQYCRFISGVEPQQLHYTLVRTQP